MDGAEKRVALPGDAYFGAPMWSPDGKRFTFTRMAASAAELWVGDAQTATARKIAGVALNSLLGAPCNWLPDSTSLLCRSVPAGRGKPPERPRVPSGPRVQESFGRSSPVPTYEDRSEERRVGKECRL